MPRQAKKITGARKEEERGRREKAVTVVVPVSSRCLASLRCRRVSWDLRKVEPLNSPRGAVPPCYFRILPNEVSCCIDVMLGRALLVGLGSAPAYNVMPSRMAGSAPTQPPQPRAAVAQLPAWSARCSPMASWHPLGVAPSNFKETVASQLV